MNCRSLFIFDIMHYKHLSRENMYKEQMISTIFANETKQKKKSIVDFHLNILLAVNVHICIKYITHNWPSMMFDSTSKKCLLVFDDIMM